MGARYGATHQAAAASNVTLLEVISGGGDRRGHIYDVQITSDAAPADQAGRFDLIRGTVSGSGTALSENKLDPADGVSHMVALGATITGQTKTPNTNCLEIPLNQRRGFRWASALANAIVVPAVTDNWVGVECIQFGAAVNLEVTVRWEE